MKTWLLSDKPIRFLSIKVIKKSQLFNHKPIYAMKIINRSMLLIFALMVGVISINGQDIQKDSTGLPGDNFNLQGTLDLFSKANDLESFEKSINDEKNNVNNLDLNGDGQIDYIKVIDRTDGNAHAIVLQAVLGNNDNQDIAVIEIEKKEMKMQSLK